MIFRFTISGGRLPQMDNKTITVRVVKWTSLTESNILHQNQYDFGPAGGVQQAVQVAYRSFPTNCLHVDLVIPASVLLWADGEWLFSLSDMYRTIQNGNVVDVHVNGTRPPGPEVPQRYTVSDGPGAPGNDHWGGSGRGEGPEAEVRPDRVGALLRELQRGTLS
jgi:hypothetical protein